MFNILGTARYRTICAFGLVLALCVHAPAVGADVPVECEIVYETSDGMYVDIGSEAGLRRGQVGSVSRDGALLGRIEVMEVASGSAFVRLVSESVQGSLAAGDRVSLVLNRAPVAEEDSESKQLSPTLKDQTNQEKPFVPLLAPPEMHEAGYTDARNVFHGRLTVRQLFQLTSDHDLQYSTTMLGTAGSLERIDGTPWTLEWSANVSYRDGDAFENSRFHRDVRTDIFNFSFVRRFDDWSTLRIGRFIPRELPSAGYLDGVQGEKVINKNFRLGGMLGVKPTRDDLDLSFREPTVVGYTTFEFGTPADLYWTGTAGVLGSLYQGQPDRLALLVDQTAQWSKLSVFASSEVDLDIGGAKVRDGVSLTRLDLYATYPLASFFVLRGGVDKYERPDTAAQRDSIDVFLDIDNQEFYDRGYWRYWLGATHNLFWNLRLSEEVSWMEATIGDDALRWNASLTRVGLPYLPSSSLTVSAYNIKGMVVDGYGGRVSGYFPLARYRLSLMPGVGFRYAETDLDNDRLEFTDVFLRAGWNISRSWYLSTGLSYGFTNNNVQRVFADVGLTFKW